MNNFVSYQSNISKDFDEMYKIYDVSRNGNQFRFMDGPPFVTGNLHLGHLAIGSIKSCILNYKSLNGYSCLNLLGYDCHGLPIESIANKELDINSLDELKNVGMEKFNLFCKEKIKEFERSWEPIYLKMGRWANFNSVYKTMDKEFMESVWWGFSKLFKKKLIYRGYKVTPYSYPLQSPLSNFEASQNYKEIDTRSIYVRFKIVDSNESNIYIVAWTTTPWTLVSNIALCVNSNLDYEYIEDESGDIYIVGKDKYKNCNIKVKNILKTVKGSDLSGLKYEPIYTCYINSKYHHIVCDDYVKDSGNTGTDVVHLAPVFGEDDYRVCMDNNIITNDDIPYLESVDENCKYNSKIEKYYGMLVFDAETQIIKDLKENKAHLKTQQIKHEYPFCYRTDTPLIYRTCESFYVNVQQIKDRMIELNKEINWIPSNIGNARFHKWLEGAKDWCISRNRYFGTPIPVWINENDSSDMIVIGSIEELEKLTNANIDDLHPEFVNKLYFEKDGKIYKRVDDIFDCWFESGSVPFAQYHYPFENQHIFDGKDSLSEFICEGIDQTRGWFYTLLILAVGLFDKKPTENIVTVGLILDSEKKKFSKKNKNYVDPNILIDTYGADTIRLYLLQSPITNAEPLCFKEDDLKNINKELFQFKNCVDFLIEHTINQQFHNVEFNYNAFQNTDNPMDIWIIQHINNTGNQIKKLMDKYMISKSSRMCLDLIEDITNWYLKFNRDRLKGKCGNNEWIVSTSVLNHIINKYILILAPFAPFISQYIHKLLNSRLNNSRLNNIPEHIHELEYQFDMNSDESILETFDLLKRISRLVRSSRMKTTTHTSSKTPIKFCEICMDSDKKLDLIKNCIDLIQSELNVIDIKYSKLSDNIKYKYVPNKAILGKKYKKFASEIYKFFDKCDNFSELLVDNVIRLYIDNQVYEIFENEYTKELIFGKDDIFDIDILIKIDFTYDEQIEKAFHLKRFISEIQRTRKQMGLHPWDKISIEIYCDEFDIVKNGVEYIKKRLECDVNPISEIKGDKFYIDDDKKISYSILKNQHNQQHL
jgi:isoleucyl-tRNA synthetase